MAFFPDLPIIRNALLHAYPRSGVSHVCMWGKGNASGTSLDLTASLASYGLISATLLNSSTLLIYNYISVSTLFCNLFCYELNFPPQTPMLKP